MAAPRIPRATYRLQLHAGFTFADAQRIIPYLSRLGVSHLYCSPFLKARAGSMHGYDIVDHNALNPEIGDMEALERLCATLRDHQMGLIMDFVPNHMGVGGADNAWWLDVLEWGEDSPYARFFDIDWQPARRELKGKVLLPFLGDHYGAVLERGELVPRLDRAEGSLSIWYWEHRHPIALRDYAELLRPAVRRLDASDEGDALADVVDDFANLAAGVGVGRAGGARRERGVELKAMLAAVASHPAVAGAIDAVLAEIPVAELHQLMERQSWRISYWRVAADEINYRRFFDINDLAALRMVEEPDLFEAAHRLTLELIRRGLVQGLRIDHVDGLFNPAEYCRMLQARAGEALGRPVSGPDDQPLYLLVEKILAHHEAIRRDWPVAGTTGYEFMNQVCGLFVDGEGEAGLDAAWRRFTGLDMDFDREVYEAKKRIIDEHMASEMRVLAVRLGRIAVSHWLSRDFTLSGLYGALKEVVACLPVYRTYVTSRRVTDTDRKYIDWALARARRLAVGDPSVYDFLQSVMDTTAAGTYSRRAVVDFVMRLQQYSGPVMAKGFEDTALYRYNRFIALNEVGGEPTRFGISASGFHQSMRARQRSHPHSLLATATHDSKRGEDVRMRIAALSEIPDEWRQHVERWGQLNAPFRKTLDSGPAPEANDEYFLYQTLIGAWPDDPVQAGDFVGRLVDATTKAVKEAKRRTSWNHPDTEYEQAVADFVHRITETDRRNPFLDDFLALRRRVARAGMIHGLAQTLVKLTCPGVPDIYQGAELWQLALVDPDNRRPVDYALRERLLGGMAEGGLHAPDEAGAVKQELIRRTLDLRRRRPALLEEGAYRPLTVRGPRGSHLLAYARQLHDEALVVAVPTHQARLVANGGGEAGSWRGTHLEVPRRPGRWRNLLTGAEVPIVTRRGTAVFLAPDLFAAFPLALLEGEGE